jgi:hypothetical protein
MTNVILPLGRSQMTIEAIALNLISVGATTKTNIRTSFKRFYQQHSNFSIGLNGINWLDSINFNSENNFVYHK